MHAHLQPVGGIAGDMFAAAVLDAWPDLEPGLAQAFARAGLAHIVSVARRPHNDGVLAGSRFEVTPSQPEADEHVHRHYPAVVKLFTDADMDDAVRRRALDVFRLLGEAEAQVHGVALERVAFHEVGAWDSIADVFSAAWLVEATGVTSWSCAAIPLGGGRVRTAHGEMAVPTPATTRLLMGCPMHDDGRAGERVTPTGAAILKHLAPEFAAPAVAATLIASGSGFGTMRLDGMSNVLRVLAFERGATAVLREPVGLCAFEVDDQSPEDLATGLEALRAMDAVHDVIQVPAFGKKGRMCVHVQVLAVAAAADAVMAACLEQTTTLGVRWQVLERAALARSSTRVTAAGHSIRVKRATRPGGGVSRKAEMDDLALAGGSQVEREGLRRAAEAVGAGSETGDE